MAEFPMNHDPVEKEGLAAAHESAVVRFGPFEFDRRTEELLRDGRGVRLQAQPSRLLGMLLERPGQIVVREEIQRRIWGDETFVHFDQGINHCIRQIRQALKDNPESPRFIETIPRRGYRFVAPVSKVTAGESAEVSAPRKRSRAAGAAPVIFLAAVLGALALASQAPWGRPSVPSEPRPVLAVLPFQNLAEPDDRQYLADAMTEDLIARLGRQYAARLGVIARTSAMKYRDTAKSVDQIGRELGADYILEGSVQPAGGSVRITAQLIRARDQVHLWAANYDRPGADTLALQSEVSHKIAQALALKLLLPEDRVVSAARTTPEVHDLYLQARHASGRRSREELHEAAGLLERALAIDPAFAPAHLTMAEVLYSLKGREAAREAAHKALALDDSLPGAHFLLGKIHFYRDYDLEGARREFERAIDLNPAYAEAFHAYAGYFSVTGRHEEAVAMARKARALDPLSPMVSVDVGWYSYFARRHDDAIAYSRETLELMPRFYWAHRCILFALLQKGDIAGAREQVLAELTHSENTEELREKIRSTSPREAMALYWEWDLERTRRWIESGVSSPCNLATTYAAMGRTQDALDALEASFEHRLGWIMPFLSVEPMLDPLRREPRFQELVKRVAQAGARHVTAN